MPFEEGQRAIPSTLAPQPVTPADQALRHRVVPEGSIDVREARAGQEVPGVLAEVGPAEAEWWEQFLRDGGKPRPEPECDGRRGILEGGRDVRPEGSVLLTEADKACPWTWWETGLDVPGGSREKNGCEGSLEASADLLPGPRRVELRPRGAVKGQEGVRCLRVRVLQHGLDLLEGA